MIRYQLKISGMTCGKCERLIAECLKEKIMQPFNVTFDRPGDAAYLTVNISENPFALTLNTFNTMI